MNQVLLAVTLCLCFFTQRGVCSTQVQSLEPMPEVHLTDYGLYEGKVKVEGDWAKGVPVTAGFTEEAKHARTTESVPCEAGINFGIRVMIANKHEDQPIKLRVEWEHPEFTTPDGKKATRETETFELKDSILVSQFFWLFVDECKYELVPGKWTLRLYANGRLAVKKVFDVQKPGKAEASPSPSPAETATPSK